MPQSIQITETSPLLHDTNCVYCHVNLHLGDQVVVCDSCRSPHQQSNYGRCATFGCEGFGKTGQSVPQNQRLEHSVEQTIQPSRPQGLTYRPHDVDALRERSRSQDFESSRIEENRIPLWQRLFANVIVPGLIGSAVYYVATTIARVSMFKRSDEMVVEFIIGFIVVPIALFWCMVARAIFNLDR